MIEAGLLACPFFLKAFPSGCAGQWQVFVKKKLIGLGLTAAGTAPDFHRIPFLFLQNDVLQKTINHSQFYIIRL